MNMIDNNMYDEEDDYNVSNQIKNPTTRIGTYNSLFNSIRSVVYQDIQNAGSMYCMNVQNLVRACISSNLEIYNLAKIHANSIEKRFANHAAQLVNCTITNAMYKLNDKLFLVEFDLSKTSQSISSAKHMNEVRFDTSYDCTAESLLAKQCQMLMATPILDTIAIKYEELQRNVRSSRFELSKSQQLLRETILRRAFTAFEFKKDMSFYTLNFSDDMSMLFWDRYTIVEITAKSYYVEQHCMIEHVVTGDVDKERFIFLHKPSKNSMAAFLSNKLACLTEMIRPQPTKIDKEIIKQTNIPEYESEED